MEHEYNKLLALSLNVSNKSNDVLISNNDVLISNNYYIKFLGTVIVLFIICSIVYFFFIYDPSAIQAIQTKNLNTQILELTKKIDSSNSLKENSVNQTDIKDLNTQILELSKKIDIMNSTQEEKFSKTEANVENIAKILKEESAFKNIILQKQQYPQYINNQLP